MLLGKFGRLNLSPNLVYFNLKNSYFVENSNYNRRLILKNGEEFYLFLGIKLIQTTNKSFV